MASSIGIEILTEEQYRELQRLGDFDLKTSSWVRTPTNVRELGAALFCDRRFGRVFVYHNSAESYYAARGFVVGSACNYRLPRRRRKPTRLNYNVRLQLD